MADRDMLLAYAALVTGAVLPIYHGSYLSLRTPASTLKLLKDNPRHPSEGIDEEEDEASEVAETLTSSDAWLFPVFGSAVLFSMYLVFKFLDKRYVDILLGFYFGLVGVAAVAKALIAVAEKVVGPARRRALQRYRFALLKRPSAAAAAEAAASKTKADDADKTAEGDKEEEHLFNLNFTILHLPFIGLSVLVVALYLVTKQWLLTNLIALSLAYNGIALMSLDSFVTGAIMLGGLFFYDVFWVFGTEVMVSVARGFDGPIKIVCPKNLVQATSEIVLALLNNGPKAGFEVAKGLKWQHTMLGLGDIVIPGIFIALALRFDQHLASTANPSRRFTKAYTSFPKPYFHATMVAYLFGLVTTMAVMTYFKAAQPALLYLSPACVGAVAITALRRGEWNDVWTWSDAQEEDKKDEDAKKGENKQGKKALTEGEEEEEDGELIDSPAKGTRNATRRRKA